MPEHQTLLAFDWGLKHIGVAVGNTLSRSPQALTTLQAKDGIPNWEEIKTLLDEWRPARLVLGEPFNMDGTPTALRTRVKKFGNRLHGRFGLPVDYVDERLSSVEAKTRLSERGHRGDYRKAPADAMAAVVILEDYFASL
ncbi:MAG: Holliday junction resolvase RuvX [Gammaproteobacteria bacterium]|nr:MAG: Holliday junction resolvase RuvX [Gammaproteobacteria bacterium]